MPNKFDDRTMAEIYCRNKLADKTVSIFEWYGYHVIEGNFFEIAARSGTASTMHPPYFVGLGKDAHRTELHQAQFYNNSRV